MTFEKDRRLGNRKKTDLTASIIGQNGVVAEVRLIDISPTGVRVNIPPDVAVSKHFKLLLGRVKIEKIAEIVWRNNTQAGVRFLTEDEIDKLDAAVINFEKARRHEDRKKTQITATVYCQNGAVDDIKLIDISATGARLDVPTEMALTKHFRLLLGRSKIEKHAELVWRTSTEAGVRFLSDEEIASLQKPAKAALAKVRLADLRKLAGLVDPQSEAVDPR